CDALQRAVSSRLRGGARVEGGCPAFGCQLMNEPVRMRRDAEQCIFEVDQGRDIDEFAALDECIEECWPAGPSKLRASSQFFRPRATDAQLVLGTVVVDGQ